METLKPLLQLESLRPLFKEGRFGIEKESQRMDQEGDLAKTDHPSIFGNRNFHPSIQTDFSETQLELITPVADSAKEVLNYLAAIHEVVLRSLPEEEAIWPLSMPPALPKKEEDIMIAKLERNEDVLYRRYLALAYGKRKQMVSGIHYNFEFSKEFLQQLYQEQTSYADYVSFETNVYLKVARNYLRYRWLIVYLLGAAPVSEPGYFTDCHHRKPKEPVRSLRTSDFGYTNHDDVFVSYETIDRYVDDIHRLVETGVLSEEKEFYSPVRLRGEKRVADLKQHGIHYIEIRNIDLNPFAPYGIDEKTIEFLQFFLMLMLWIDPLETDADQLLKVGNKRNNEVSLEHPLTKTSYYEEGHMLLTQMKEMAKALHLLENECELINWVEELLENPQKTLSGQLVTEYEAGLANADLGKDLGWKNKAQALEKTYQLAGFRDMELSTQILMFDAIQKGIDVTVLDRQDQILRLSYADHVEYVKKANMTSLDNYIVPLIMENKTVTKKLLAQAGFKVPRGREFSSVKEALNASELFLNKGFVVKPKSTNYGIGISIFKEGASFEAYQEAVEIAFKEDQAVLVEEFIEGTEYRFFTIDGQVKAVMLRVPANVVGDGVKRIDELVADKNKNPLRGTHHRAPLQLIELGTIETLMLKEQGYTPETVLPKGVTAYLRENSNVSTGGDSIDVTEEMLDSYKQIAGDAAKSLGAVISGMDLIIFDPKKEGKKDSDSYAIIEANFNPAMHMHAYPESGKGRRLTRDVLDLLFKELPKD